MSGLAYRLRISSGGLLCNLPIAAGHACAPTSDLMSVSVAGIQKNRCRTTVAETIAGNASGTRSVCLGRNQAAEQGLRRPRSRVFHELGLAA